MKTENDRAPRVLISGGGTGGHIFPALSIADAVKRRWPDAEILFVGAKGRMEMERVPQAGYEIEGLDVAGFDRKRLWRNFAVIFKLIRSLWKARRIVRRFKPDVVVGVGGYASGPTLKAAQRAGIPTVLQEQNSYPGVTNKLLAKKAIRICTAYPDMERYFPAEKIIMTGNPTRKNLAQCPLTQAQAKEKLGFDPGRPLILVVGGSLGAGTLNRFMSEYATQLTDVASVLWQTGRNGYPEAEKTMDSLHAQGKCLNIKATEFVTDMAAAYTSADLVVARAGAGTISELQNLGKAAILVPSPNVAEDHQRHNAEALSDRDAAVTVLDADADTQLFRAINDYMAPERLAQLSENIKNLALKDADEKIVDVIAEILNK